MTNSSIRGRAVRATTMWRTAFLVTASSLAVALAMSPAVAQQASATTNVDVPAGPLDTALRTLSQQLSLQLIYAGELVAGKSTPGASGLTSIDAAVAQVLRGTGLTFRIVNGRTIQIELPAPGEAGERVLGPVRVEGSQDDVYVSATRGDGIAQLGGIRGRQDKEVDGYRARVAAAGTGSPMAIEDIPRSLTVLTPEQIAKQDVVTLDDALLRLPGVTVSQTTGLISGPASIFVRGYQVDQYQVDGGTSRSLTNSHSTLVGAPINLDSFERVELLRGPNSLFVGEGSPGGSINLIRKRPGAASAESLTLEGGSYGRLDAVADASTPSLFGSPIAFRAIASIHRNKSEIAGVSATTKLLYAIADAPLGDNARLEVGAQYNSLDANGEYNGQSRYLSGDLINFGREFNYAAGSGAFNKTSSKEVFVNLTGDIRDNWGFELGGFYRSTSSDFRSASLDLSAQADGSLDYPGAITVEAIGPNKSEEIGISSKLTGRFLTFGLKHNVFAQMSYSRLDAGQPASQSTPEIATISSIADLKNPVYDPIAGTDDSAYTGVLFGNVGVVLGDTISWRDIISVTATLRRDTINQAIVNVPRFAGVLGGISTPDSFGSGSWRPSFSASVKPIKRLTLYGSYSDGFRRQDDKFSRSGTTPNFTYAPLPPTPYRNLEAGVKYGGDRWLASIAIYDMKQKNVGIVQAPLYSNCPSAIGSTVLKSPCFFASGVNSKSRGVDFDFSGQIATGLSVVASYNYNKTKQITPGFGEGLPLQTLAPQSSGNVFIDWSPSFARDFALQVGARYKGRYFNAGVNYPPPDYSAVSFKVTQRAYVVADVGVDYQLSKNVGLRLFVENVTNTEYFSTIQAGRGNFYGSPRTFVASLKLKNIGNIPEDGQSPTTGLAPFGDPADWYAALDIGYNFAGNLDGKAKGLVKDNSTPVRWNFETKNAPVLAGRLGYHIVDNLRGELEIDYRRAEFGSIGGAKIAPYGVCGAIGSTTGAPFDCDHVPGKTEQWSLIGNALYDFGQREALFRPFVGGGLGLSRNSVDFRGKLQGIGGTGPFTKVGRFGTSPDFNRVNQETVAGVSTKTSVVWQAIAGAALRLSDRLSLDATYRYVRVPGMKFTSYNLDEPVGAAVPLTPRIGTFKTNYSSQIASLGMRWTFGSQTNP